MEHTKGPWRAKEGMIYSESDQSGATIALCKSEANAHLIASCPELLEACKYALVQVQQDNFDRKVPDEYRMTEKMLEQAIQKAEGRE